MKLDHLNLKSLINRDTVDALISSLKEVANSWSDGIILTIKLVGSLSVLIALISAIIVGVGWFITTFGTGTFIFSLIVSSFVLSVLTTAAVKRNQGVESSKTPKK